MNKTTAQGAATPSAGVRAWFSIVSVRDGEPVYPSPLDVLQS